MDKRNYSDTQNCSDIQIVQILYCSDTQNYSDCSDTQNQDYSDCSDTILFRYLELLTIQNVQNLLRITTQNIYLRI